jgi:diguanylate cyclase (GGDEF)-like protein
MVYPVPDPEFEERRLGALGHYNILDTPPEEAFDRITRLARAVTGAPIALISLIDSQREWFKSRQGLPIPQTPRDVAFGAHAIAQDAPLIVADTRKDRRFSDYPLVVRDPKIRFYVGVPLRALGGYNIGTLAVMDKRPRQPASTQVALLRDLAGLAMDELELRRFTPIDELTGALNRTPFMREAQQVFELARRYRRGFSCIMLDVDQFKVIRDSQGVAAGDGVLKAIAATCRTVIRSVDLLGRFGGAVFAIVLPETELAAAQVVAERLRAGIAAAVGGGATSSRLDITVSVGLAAQDSHDEDMARLASRADGAMFRAKFGGGNHVVVASSGMDLTPRMTQD